MTVPFRPNRPPGPATAEAWTDAVLRSIATMRERFGDDLPLQTLAQAARLSPFHFHRIFQRVTDATPARFLAAWRMAEAKRMLAYGSESVTDICMRIGYTSLGTFTSQFARVVGVPPGRFRRVVGDCADIALHEALEASPRPPEPVTPQVTVTVTGGPDRGALVAVGLFPSGIPQGRPAACAITELPATVRLGDLPDGLFHPMAVCFDESVTLADAMMASDLDHGCYVAAAPVPVEIGGPAGDPPEVELRLRPRRDTDPPVILALPLLMGAAAGGHHLAAGSAGSPGSGVQSSHR
ncbi:AraC family transcriptional regulator [Couchioplanes caeruleus]|uniref:helix-turn-helix transcriptional regulator n=1 Tax=Couchioplanes caeruleus TaxID=56438 RepID=UPI0020C10759|nr:AraC family transcriptional regulator [Couchioplanes caeruleus]UQU67729.1 AraC family transcriptional regulator [Couchioplanes caeruleus]